MRCTDTCCQPGDIIESLVLSRKWIKKTRKPHTCNTCGKEIPAGTSCKTIAALIDGDFWSAYMHNICE